MPPDRPGSLSVAVLCWDLGHNALGRAHLLADMLAVDHDVEIVGSHFPEFGADLWPPLRDTGLGVRRYPGGPFPEHLRTMERMARELTADVVYVVKPRLPGLGVGFLAKVEAGRPLMVDCDDLELSFVGADRGLSLADLEGRALDADCLRPQGRTWTAFSEWGVRFADSVTVSNVPLAARYGGSVIPHARDERVFDPERYDREEARARLGLTDEHRVVLFAGTPRLHKGIQQIAAALSRIGDRRNRLCVLATPELAQLKSQVSGLEEWVHPVPPEPFSRLPQLLRAADVVCLLQDPSSETARWQMPAKVSDALAMGVPCLATRMPPLLPLIEEGGLVPVTDDDLDFHLESMLTDPGARAEQARRGRAIFLRRLSYAAVRPRLEDALRRAAACTGPPPPDLVASVSFLRSRFAPAPARPTNEEHPRPGAAGAPPPLARRQTRHPTVLAVVPYLGAERGLDRCLSSLVAQTRPPDGIVVVDDASPEPPVGVVRRFPGVTLLRSDAKVGAYDLIGQVVDDTAADWYLLQDADGWSAADRLERLLAAASEAGAELAGSDHVLVAPGEGLTVPHAYPVDVNAALVSAASGPVLHHPSTLVRRRLLERVGRYGDGEFLPRAAAVTPVVNVPRALYFQAERSPRARPPSGATAPGVALEHLCGPAADRRPGHLAAPRAALGRAVRRLTRPPFRATAPTFVVGAPASGADTVFWALAQHPALVAVPDLSWCAPAAEVVEGAGDPVATRHVTGSPHRRLLALDGVGATPDDVRRALATSVAKLVGAGRGDASG
ncbi:MAG TPA: glycosyltransferase, partial [Acidimicrobiales bacterium]|nr:glycosyltransferase [Acidimicrobiales bacterium]